MNRGTFVCACVKRGMRGVELGKFAFEVRLQQEI